MLFNSWEFLILLLITFALFYALPRGPYKHAEQSIVLLVATTVFYGWQDWSLLILLTFSCLMNCCASLIIAHCKAQDNEPRAKRVLRLAIIANIGLLAIFKYASFIMGNIPFCHTAWVDFSKSIPLPIGISF